MYGHPHAWLAGVRRVGKTTLTRSLPEAECFYLNCDSPRVAQSVADPEFFFQQVKRPIVIFDEIHQLPGRATTRGRTNIAVGRTGGAHCFPDRPYAPGLKQIFGVLLNFVAEL
ncbi:MAG: hypothetical protein FJ398_10465 [Verrucomicrobia bacterium]|nr:hypothetical protein [Verrucomicrobiota bacterium]